jgi:hypothetical protein
MLSSREILCERSAEIIDSFRYALCVEAAPWGGFTSLDPAHTDCQVGIRSDTNAMASCPFCPFVLLNPPVHHQNKQMHSDPNALSNSKCIRTDQRRGLDQPLQPLLIGHSLRTLRVNGNLGAMYS